MGECARKGEGSGAIKAQLEDKTALAFLFTQSKPLSARTMRFSTPAALLSLSALVSTALGATYYPTILTPTEGEAWVAGESRSVSWYVLNTFCSYRDPTLLAVLTHSSGGTSLQRRSQTIPEWAASETIAETAELRMGFLVASAASSTGYAAYWRKPCILPLFVLRGAWPVGSAQHLHPEPLAAADPCPPSPHTSLAPPSVRPIAAACCTRHPHPRSHVPYASLATET